MAIQGQVKWFDPKKGYGFIIGPEGQDVFVHYSQIQEEGFRLLKDGEIVTYEPIESEKGFQARSVYRTGTGKPTGRADAAETDTAESTDAPAAPEAGISVEADARFNGRTDQ